MENSVEQQHSEMTPNKIEFFRNKLLEKQANLVEMVEHRRKEALEDHSKGGLGDLSGYPQHIADMGTEEFSREFDFILLRRQQQELEEIREALKRIDDGVYGICQRTGGEIPLRRLEAMPEARFNINVREQEELKARPENHLQG